MFIVSKADAAAIRAAFEQGGELSASVELRRLFPNRWSMPPARGPSLAESLSTAAPRGFFW
jgi:hypothetical protein